MQELKTILVTGGAGFIGSHLTRHLVRTWTGWSVVNLDVLTYAGNLENLADLEGAANYSFVKGDIVEGDFVEALFEQYRFDGVIHLAAESHVDRSIADPMAFVRTNVLGTGNLLSAARKFGTARFYHVSTDEVYGSLGSTGYFTEETPYDPRSPYSASKAASDHLARAYFHTYGLPVVISNCSNNYGPFQFPEKLIPLTIRNIRENKPIPVYGDGLYTRDWLWVGDHVRAMDAVFHQGKDGRTYNIGGNNEWTNIDLVQTLCDLMDELLGREPGTSRSLIAFVKDRPGHDRRYAIDSARIRTELGWQPLMPMREGLRETARWYLENENWLDHVTSGAYRQYYEQQYGQSPL